MSYNYVMRDIIIYKVNKMKLFNTKTNQIEEFKPIKENEVSIHICEKLGFHACDEVNIEENIYGESYQNGHSVSFSPSHYGKYIRLIWEADKRD